MFIGPRAASTSDRLRPDSERGSRFKQVPLFTVFIRSPGPVHDSGLTFAQKSDEISPASRKRYVKKASNNLQAHGQLQIWIILCDRLRDLKRADKAAVSRRIKPSWFSLLELFEAQVFSNDENLLTMLVWSQNFCAFTNHKHTVVRIEEAQQVVGIRNDVAG